MHTIDHTVAKTVADDFIKFASADRKFTGAFDDFTADDILRATIVFAECVDGYMHLSGTYQRVGDALTGKRAIGKTDAIESARLGFGFVTAFSKFDGIGKTTKWSTKIQRNVAKSAMSSRYTFGTKSRLAGVLASSDVSTGLGLSATAFSDYGADGFNADGLSYSNRGTHTAGSVSATTLAGLNAVQRNGYRATAAVVAAASLFAKLADSAAALSKSVRHADAKYASKLAANGDIAHGSHVLATESLDADKCARYAAGAQFVADNGVGYVRYVTDRAGRQYAVGSWNHFDTAVLMLVLSMDSVAAEHLGTDTRGNVITADRAADCVARFAAGDVDAVSIFFKRQIGKTAGGKTVIRSAFDFSAFAAAVYFFSQRA